MNQKTALLSLLLFCVAAASRSQAPDPSPLRLLPGDGLVAPAAADQTVPMIARGGDRVLAVWADNRANPYGVYPGSEYETSRDIYGTRLDLGGNVLDPVPLPIAARKSIQDNPRVAWNGSNWLVVYESYDLGGTGYYYQKSLEAVRVSPAGQVLDASPIKLFGLTPPAAGYWAVASDGNNWVVVNESTSVSGDIVAVRISPAGVLLDPPTHALLRATYYGRSNLQLAFAGGVFLLTLDDEYVNGTSNTKAIRFDSGLNLLDPAPALLLNVPVSSLTGNDGQFYIVWNQQQPDYSMVLTGSRLSTAGQKLDGSGVKISGTHPAQAFTTTAVVWDGVNWRATWFFNGSVYAARVSATGTVLDPGGVAVSGPQSGPTTGDGNGGLQLVWSELANGNSDVFTARVGATSVAGPNRVLSVGAPRQLRADAASSGQGSMVVYSSGAASATRLLAQPLDASGNASTSAPIPLDSGNSGNAPSYANVAWNGSLYLVVWGNSSGVVGQRLLPDGTKVDAAPFVVMSAATSAFGAADVAALGDDFLVAGRKIGINIQYIFPAVARVRGSDGAVLDAAPVVLGQSFVGRVPAVAALGGRWLVVWHRNATHDDPYALTQGAFMSPDGTTTPEFGVHGPFSTAGGNGIFELGLASSGDVALMVQSQELSSGVETDLLGRLIQANGTVGPMFDLTPWVGNQYRPRVAWDGAEFVVVFQDQKNRLAPWTLDQLDARSDLFAMRITQSGGIVDAGGFLFTASEAGETDPNVAASNGITLIVGSAVLNDSVHANYRILYEQLDGSANPWPVAAATASPASGDVPLTVSFSSAGSSDPAGAIAAYAWDFGDGATSAEAGPVHTYAAPGAYLATLTVTDDAGAATTQAIRVNATAPNRRPVAAARASVTAGAAPLDVIFYADGSYDPDGFIGNIYWTFGDGWDYWGSPAYHTFSSAGTFTVTLTVFDSGGATGSNTLKITVGGSNQPPIAVASASPTSGAAPLLVNFSSSGSYDPDGTIVSYGWTMGDGGTSAAANPQWTYAAAGTYMATLTVTDGAGATASSSVNVTVSSGGALRSTAINLSAKLRSGVVTATGQVVVKDARGTAVPGAAVAVTWTKPNGAAVSQTATSGGSGTASFSTTGGRGTYTLTVNDITKAGYTFDRAHSVLSRSVTK